jgi:hypothetical protein
MVASIIRIQSPFVRFGVFIAETMKKAVFWDVMRCGSCKNRHFAGTFFRNVGSCKSDMA